MTNTYSTYDAKTRFSEILRKVRAGQRVFVSYHGRPVAEIRPIEEDQSLEQRMDRLQRQGLVVSAEKAAGRRLRPGAQRPGALERFLDSRD